MNVTLRLTGSRTLDVPAYRVPGFPVLVAHRGAGTDRHTRDAWRLTHAPTGLLVTGRGFDTRATALAAGRAVGPLADWSSLPMDDHGAMRELGRRVIDALDGRLPSDAPDSRLSSDAPAPTESVVESLLPDGWELLGDDLDGTLVCPHGHYIEFDGACMDGCISPLRMKGLI